MNQGGSPVTKENVMSLIIFSNDKTDIEVDVEIQRFSQFIIILCGDKDTHKKIIEIIESQGKWKLHAFLNNEPIDLSKAQYQYYENQTYPAMNKVLVENQILIDLEFYDN